jgi:hypothetical protein
MWFLTTFMILLVLAISKPMITGKGWYGEDVDNDEYLFILIIWCVCMAYGVSGPYMMQWSPEHDYKPVIEYTEEKITVDQYGNETNIKKGKFIFGARP